MNTETKEDVFAEITYLLRTRGVNIERDSLLLKSLQKLMDMVPDDDCDHNAGNYNIGPGGSMECADCGQEI